MGMPIRDSAAMTPATQPGGSGSSKMSVRVKQIDAFTDVPLSGSPVAVVVDAGGLTEKEMHAIAREMALPGTAFVLPSSAKDAHLRIRWFNQIAETTPPGYATIASFHALAEECLHGMLDCGEYRFMLETLSGILPVAVAKMHTGTTVWFEVTLPVFKRASIQKLDVMRTLNISLDEFESRLPMVSDQFLYVPIRRLHTVFALQPNMFALSQFLSNRNLEGMCVFTTETVDRDSFVHSRFFAPNMGLNEEAVTGSANGYLGAYLLENGALEEGGIMRRQRRSSKSEKMIAENKTITIMAEQGDAIGRKGRVSVQLLARGNQVTAITIGGKAVTVFDGELLIA